MLILRENMAYRRGDENTHPPLHTSRMWQHYVQHARNLPLEQRAGFVQTLRQDTEDLTLLLWQPQDPDDRQSLFNVLEHSRLALEALGYDILPRYSPDPEYEDDPPAYSPFVPLPVSFVLPLNRHFHFHFRRCAECFHCRTSWRKSAHSSSCTHMRLLGLEVGIHGLTALDTQSYDDAAGGDHGARLPKGGIRKAAKRARQLLGSLCHNFRNSRRQQSPRESIRSQT